MNIDEDQEVQVDGRSKEARAARAAGRQPRSPSRAESTHEPIHDAGRGGIVATGRDGQILTRTAKSGIDEYQIDPAMVPKGWDYQWNTVSVIGNSDVVRTQSLQMYRNGWRPVPAERHDGIFLPVGAKGEIVVGGLRLEERPKSLSIEARNEDLRNAHQLVSDRNDSLKLTGLKDKMGPGFEMNSRRYRNTGGDVRLSMDASLDNEIPRPSHTLAEPGE